MPSTNGGKIQTASEAGESKLPWFDIAYGQPDGQRRSVCSLDTRSDESMRKLNW
jgi:hypothetical protein